MTRRSWLLVRGSLFGFVAACAAAQTASSPKAIIEQLERTVHYRDIAISPDGDRIAWAQTSPSTEDVIIHTLAWRKPGAAAIPVVLRSGTSREDSEPAWSPDSKSLAFFSDIGHKGQAQLFLSQNGASSRALTQLQGYAERPRWSPDGKEIAFLYTESGGGGGPLNAAEAQTGVIGGEIHNQRIAVLNAATGKLRQVSPADLHVYDFDWSPDGSRFVVTAAPGPGDNNWWIAQIYVVDIGSGKAQSIYKPSLQVAIPRWSPDGKQIAFIEGLMSDEGFHGGDLFTMPAAGGSPVNRTPGRKSSPSSLTWTSPERIVFTEWVGGGSAIAILDMNSGATETLWRGVSGLHSFGYRSNFALAKDGRTAAAVRESMTTPPEVWAGLPGDWTQLTHNNAAEMPSWGDAINVEWDNAGHRVQGWLVPPKQVAPGRRYPMVVDIHGGPSNLTTQAWPSSVGAVLNAAGYYVFYPNPRGSYGQGESFTRANVKDFGGGDLNDILTGIDEVIAHYPVDADRLGVTGWSYGGYMTMWTVTQTHRFRAAMAGAGIADWASYYGENLIDQWMIPFFGASVYQDPAVYERSSPLHFITNVKTPTLVIVGERDAECPAPQSFEFWHALKTLGVPVKLIVYPGEGHMFQKQKDRIDVSVQTLSWFNEYLRQR